MSGESGDSRQEHPFKAKDKVLRKTFGDQDGDPEYPFVLLVRDAKLSPGFADWLLQTFHGLKKGMKPKCIRIGAGGTYCLFDTLGEPVSVFKPKDEEPNAKNNPKWNKNEVSGEGEGTYILSDTTGEHISVSKSSNDDDESNASMGAEKLTICGLRGGAKVGQGATREEVAYLLDHPKNRRREGFDDEVGYGGVPRTIMIYCLNRKFTYGNGYRNEMGRYKCGSLQEFKNNNGNCAKLACDPDVSVEEVHKISLLDIRFANSDRHLGNILLAQAENGTNVLIPIDHAYCIPTNFSGCRFEWRSWQQAKVAYNKEFIEYIKSLDVDKDIQLLVKHKYTVGPKFETTLRVSTTLLQKGVLEQQLTPSQIGDIMCTKQKPDNLSIIEDIVEEARYSVINFLGTESYHDKLIKAIPSYMDSGIKKYKDGLDSNVVHRSIQ